MPAIADTNSTVLVTGANGFLATWIVGDLLARGYSVHAAVRSEDKGQNLLKIYASYGHKLKLFAIGPDMSADGAFNEAVKGVDAVLHTAASVHLNAKEPREMIDPAVKGMVGVLESVLKHGASVKRVVITSSSAAIQAWSAVPMTRSEENWNDGDVKECEEKGKDANPLAMYAASKTLAERAAWDFYNKHKSEINWDICFLNPPWIFGPVKHDVKSIDSLNESNLFLYKAMVKNDFGGYPPQFAPGHGWVDVRDVSEAHIRAMETPAAGGERIVVCAESFVWQDFVDVANSITPPPWKSHTAPLSKGDPEAERVRAITWITDKEKRILGLKYKTKEETARDILEDYENHGWA